METHGEHTQLATTQANTITLCFDPLSGSKPDLGTPGAAAISLADQQDLAAALARQAIGSAPNDRAAEESATLAVKSIAVALETLACMATATEAVDDGRRAMFAWSTDCEVASHMVGADCLLPIANGRNDGAQAALGSPAFAGWHFARHL
jgi:hypothetical protein